VRDDDDYDHADDDGFLKGHGCPESSRKDLRSDIVEIRSLKTQQLFVGCFIASVKMEA